MNKQPQSPSWWMGRGSGFVLSTIGLFIAMVVVASSGGALINVPASASASAQEIVPAVADAADVEAFLDEVMARQMEELGVIGATVSVVSNGEIVLVKGYGYADTATETPVNGYTTAFDVGSVSKLLTWTAVMQQVEQGRLDLDADVNQYLTSFQVPDTFDEPLRVRHLLTHTTGFADITLGLFVRTADEVNPLREVLAENMPDRKLPPGQLTVYSNYGTALAGFLVEEVTGIPFRQYVKEHVLDPLGIQDSSLDLPLPEDVQARRATGYGALNRPVGTQFPYVPYAPAGGFNATASDMAGFMIAHLQGGEYEGTRILQPETVALMHSTLFSHHPGVNGNAHGFWEFGVPGRRVIGHEGDLPGFHSMLRVLPEENVGLFVSYNNAGGTLARFELWDAFLDRYFPPEAVEPGQPVTDPARITGTYAPTRVPEEPYLRVFGAFNPMVVEANGNGMLTVTSFLGSNEFWQREAGLFESVDGRERLAFWEDGNPEAVYLLAGALPMFAFERVPWYESLNIILLVAGIGSLLFLSALIVALVRWWRGRRRDTAGRPPGERYAGWVGAGLAVTFLAFFIGFGVLAGGGLLDEIIFGIPTAFQVLLLIPVAAVALTTAGVVFAALAWARRYWGVVGRVHYSLVVLAGVASSWLVLHWNLIGWHTYP